MGRVRENKETDRERVPGRRRGGRRGRGGRQLGGMERGREGERGREKEGKGERKGEKGREKEEEGRERGTRLAAAIPSQGTSLRYGQRPWGCKAGSSSNKSGNSSPGREKEDWGAEEAQSFGHLLRV